MEWTNPRYAMAVALLSDGRVTASTKHMKRCSKCWGYRRQIFVSEDGAHHSAPCLACHGSGLRRVRSR